MLGTAHAKYFHVHVRSNMHFSLYIVCGTGGTVIQLGACDDKATAADTAKLSATAYTGAATYTFIQAIEKYGPSQTYASLLAHTTEALAGLGKSSVQNASAGSSAVAAGLPLVMGAVLGPLGLVAGAQLAAFSSECQVDDECAMRGVLLLITCVS